MWNTDTELRCRRIHRIKSKMLRRASQVTFVKKLYRKYYFISLQRMLLNECFVEILCKSDLMSIKVK